MLTVGLCHRTIHINIVCLALPCIVTAATGLVDVVLVVLASQEAHGVRIHHLAVDLHRTRIFGNDDAVALAQHHVSVAAGMLHSFLKVDTHRIDGTHVNLADVNGVLARATLGSLHQRLLTGQFLRCALTHETCTLGKGSRRQATSLRDDFAQSLTLLR